MIKNIISRKKWSTWISKLISKRIDFTRIHHQVILDCKIHNTLISIVLVNYDTEVERLLVCVIKLE